MVQFKEQYKDVVIKASGVGDVHFGNLTDELYYKCINASPMTAKYFAVDRKKELTDLRKKYSKLENGELEDLLDKAGVEPKAGATKKELVNLVIENHNKIK